MHECASMYARMKHEPCSLDILMRSDYARQHLFKNVKSRTLGSDLKISLLV